MEWMNETEHGTELFVRVVPRAAKNEIKGVHDGALKIRITTPPIDGKANKALIEFLSKTLNCPKAEIELVRGETARRKTICIRGLTPKDIQARIIPHA